jgi:ribosomal protein S27AE
MDRDKVCVECGSGPRYRDTARCQKCGNARIMARRRERLAAGEISYSDIRLKVTAARLGLSQEAYRAARELPCCVCGALPKGTPNVGYGHRETGEYVDTVCRGCLRILGFLNHDPDKAAATLKLIERANETP